MNASGDLRGLRVGCVQYLNAQPLIVAHEGPVIFDHPSVLARELGEGRLDVALVPSFEALRRPDFPVVNDVSISSRGPVYSVFLAYQGELSEIRRTRPDPASKTSNRLLHCLFRERFGVDLEWSDDAEARLLIGNQAIKFRQDPGPGWRFWDLGEAWNERTQLPFVYALWSIHPRVADPSGVASALRQLKDRGLPMRPEICRRQNGFGEAFCRCYLEEHIRFDFGPAEQKGLRHFARLAGCGEVVLQTV